MAYLLISFIVSDSLAAGEGSGSAFRLVFYVSLTVATVPRFDSAPCPECCPPRRASAKVLLILPIFVPATAIAIFFFTSNLSYTDAGIAFAVMSVHAILFTWLNGTADYYAQARIYPIASILSLHHGLGSRPVVPQHLLRLCSGC